jgi:hypothetical protein
MADAVFRKLFRDFMMECFRRLPISGRRFSGSFSRLPGRLIPSQRQAFVLALERILSEHRRLISIAANN